MKKIFPILMLSIASVSLTEAGFVDVPETHPNYEAINYVQTQEIVKGYADGTYKPGQLVNRAEMLKIVTESVFAEQSRTGNCADFPDVGANDWFMPYVCFGQSQEIVAGYGDGTFKPGNTIIFAEASKIVAKAFNWEVPEISDIWFKPFVDQLAFRNAIPLSITSFDHQLTRGEMAEIIYRVHAKNTTKISQTYTSIENGVLPTEAVEESPEETPFVIEETKETIKTEESTEALIANPETESKNPIKEESTDTTKSQSTNTPENSGGDSGETPTSSSASEITELPETIETEELVEIPEIPEILEVPEIEEIPVTADPIPTENPSESLAYWMTTENGVLTENRANGLKIQLVSGKIKITETNNGEIHWYIGYEKKSDGTEIFADYWKNTDQQTSSLTVLPSGNYYIQSYGITIDSETPPAVIQGYTMPSS